MRLRSFVAPAMSLCFLAACSSTKVEEKPPPPDSRMLHVPSPEWPDQVIYFVFTDRFANGDPSNDDQGAGEYDRRSGKKYSGGDLAGIIARLDYIQTLGATAVWITPPVAGQWWDPRVDFGGFHGYWALNPKEVDAHQGTLETYKDLSHALHSRGMSLVQDIVPNHMGNFFAWDGAYNPSDPTKNFVINTETKPSSAPTLAPFDLNDVRRAEDRAAAIYHFTPSIADFTDVVQEKTWAISDLDDLNTSNPVVRKALRGAYGYWIKEVGVDGFRIDTVKFVEKEFWPDFLHSTDAEAPGLERVAADTGRSDFLTFGEIFETSGPFDDSAERKIAEYLGTPSEPSLDAALAFPLYAELKRVLAEGRPTAQLGDRLEKMVDPAYAPRPFLTPTFIDNHDVQRFAATGSRAAVEQALLAIMTLPGIPVIYQGTEQGYEEPRAAMFQGGFGSQNRDHFETDSATFVYLRDLIAARRGSSLLRRGDLEVLRTNAVRPGVIAYARREGAQTAVVVMNTSDARVLLDPLDASLGPGAKLEVIAGREGAAPIVADHQGRLYAELPARASMVWRTTGESEAVSAPTESITVVTAIDGQTFDVDTAIRGRAVGITSLRVVIDEALEEAATVAVEADGTWTSTLSLSGFRYGQSTHTLTLYAPNAKVASPRATFTVNRVFDGAVVTIEDPANDDIGPTGTYVYPTDETFGHQGDIVGVTVEAGDTLTLRFEMAEVTSVWAPQNGYDHVSFNIYFEVPGSAGATVLPQLDATAPDGFTWRYTHFSFGWANTLFGSSGATPTEMGAPVAAAPDIAVGEAERTISFTYAQSAFGVSTWTGARVYVTTWDFDGIDAKYRDLSPKGGQWSFGGAELGGAKILDSVGPFQIPSR